MSDTSTSTSTTARTAVVIGGSGGIGKAVVERLAADGMSVLVHYSGSSARAEETVKGITAAGGTATVFGGDVADEQAMAGLFQHTTDTFGGIDVVINTAGIMPLAPIAEMDLDTFDRIQRTNVRGTFVVSQLAAARCVRAGQSSTSPRP